MSTTWFDEIRRSIDKELDSSLRAERGQFMTNSSICSFMSGLFELSGFEDEVRILDPGAGIGSLTASLVEKISSVLGDIKLEVNAYEIDSVMRSGLLQTAARLSDDFGAKIRIIPDDFVEHSQRVLGPSLFEEKIDGFSDYDLAILNPPYKKISSDSRHRKLLSSLSIETSNLYSAFMALSILHLREGGQMVAIVPRSFCNGTYFRLFRTFLRSNFKINRIHLFDSRKDAFKENQVLQENMIISGYKQSSSRIPEGEVLISRSSNDRFDDCEFLNVSEDILWGKDREGFLFIPSTLSEASNIGLMSSLPCGLLDLGVSVSTGPVVAHRLRSHFRAESGIPMVYCSSVKNGLAQSAVEHTKNKPYIHDNDSTRKWLVPERSYLLVRRFSSKEEARRINCSVYLHGEDQERLGIDNKLNFFHFGDKPMPIDLIYGLYVYLSSSLVDQFYRIFSGHTQINSGDLRAIRYPSLASLESVGRDFKVCFSTDQGLIDSAAQCFFRENN